MSIGKVLSPQTIVTRLESMKLDRWHKTVIACSAPIALSVAAYGTGQGFFQVDSSVFPLDVSWSVSAADFDNDGDIDLLNVLRTQPAQIWLNDGLGGFVFLSNVFEERSAGYYADCADFDLDGDIDVVIADSFAPTRVWLNNGDATFSEGPVLQQDAYNVTTGDIDGDGDIDICTAGGSIGQSLVLLNRIESGEVSFEVVSGFTGNLSDIALGDVDCDGDLDAVSVGLGSSANTVLWNLGDEQFVETPLEISSGHYGGIELLDIDLDGDLDAYVGGQGLPFTDLLLLNDGRGGFADSGMAVGTGSAYDVAIIDLNGDQWPDVFVTNRSSPSDTFLNVNGRLIKLTHVLPSANSTGAAVANLDGDGDDDVVLANFKETNLHLAERRAMFR